MGRGDLTERGFVVSTSLAESFKVVLGGEPQRCFVHHLEIEFPVGLHRVVTEEGIALCVNEITVGTSFGREARVHILADALGAPAADVAWQNAVETVTELVSVKLLVGVEVTNHCTGVDAGVCGNRLTEQCAQTLLHFFLHRHAVGLYLPAMVSCAVETQPKEYSHIYCLLNII